MRRRDGNKRRRVERQEEAKVRQATYDALSLTEKLDRAMARGNRAIGSSATREIVRLARELHGDKRESISAVRLA